MWIHSIKLRNFKSYEDAAFRFPEPKEGKNLILIGAQNGHGKTTLLEAIYLGLYDKEAINHLTRAGLNTKENNYPEFLKSALFHEAPLRYGQYTMALEIEIHQRYQGILHGVKIERKWYFDYDKKPKIAENEVFFTLIKDQQEFPVAHEQIGMYLNAYALPMDYAPFFFFDGEKIVQAAQGSGAGVWLNKALQGLLGVTLLHHLREDLKTYRSNCISENASQKLQSELNEKERKLQLAAILLENINEEYQALEGRITQCRQERDRLTNQLGKGGDIRTSKDFLVQENQLKLEVEAFQTQIKNAVKAMPLAFLPRTQLTQLQKQLEQEKNRLNHEAAKEQAEGRVEDFWNAFIASDKVKEVLGRSAANILADELMKEAVRDCWEKLFYPLPTHCASHIEHNYLSLNAHAEIKNEIEKLKGMPNDKISELLAKIEQYEQERKNVRTEIEALEGTNNDELAAQLKAIITEMETLSHSKGLIEQNKLHAEQNHQRLNTEVRRLQDEISLENPKLIKSRRAGNVDNVILRITEELLKQKTEEIGEVATRINREIAHDERIDRIYIESSGRMGLFGKNGLETRVDLSAGQMQILIMALVSALAEVTRYQAPFVIDTPLARLDEQHRQGLFKHWKNLNQQVILLSQDTEITSEVYRQLEPHIGRTYLVEAESLSSAGAKSRLTVDAYFE